METKVCKKCGRELPLSEFYAWRTEKKVFYKGVCKACYEGKRQTPAGMRVCKNCGELKPLSEFKTMKNGNISTTCTDCVKKIRAVYSDAKKKLLAELNVKYKRLRKESLPKKENRVDDDELCPSLIKIEKRDGLYVVLVRLIYLDCPDTWQWKAVYASYVRHLAINMMRKCVKMSCAKLKMMAKNTL